MTGTLEAITSPTPAGKMATAAVLAAAGLGGAAFGTWGIDTADAWEAAGTCYVGLNYNAYYVPHAAQIGDGFYAKSNINYVQLNSCDSGIADLQTFKHKSVIYRGGTYCMSDTWHAQNQSSHINEFPDWPSCGGGFYANAPRVNFYFDPGGYWDDYSGEAPITPAKCYSC